MTGVQDARVKALNDHDLADGRYVLYWMQQSQRARFNHALEHAAMWANDLNKPLLVAFGLMDDYPEANARHYAFLLEGLQDVAEALAERRIAFVVQRGRPDEVALRLAQDAALLVCDRGYLRHQRLWRERVAREARCRVVQVESDVVVPVEVASDKKEHAARTLRPKLTRHLETYLRDVEEVALRAPSRELGVEGLDLTDPGALLASLKLDTSVAPVRRFRGGTREGERVLRAFLRERFGDYAATRNQPQTNNVSHMSKYLHFGQISPVFVALEVQRAGAGKNAEVYLEELIVRRELPMNFVFYEPHYDRYDALPAWARKTLDEHRGDAREHLYTREQLEAAETHDPYWNAAMKEMLHTGYMHNYMRMYWGKKILEWSPSPEEAFETALHLNNRYFLDGRDANSYANVAWVFGQHDRPWAERAVCGKVRYLSAGGLERKADPKAYVRKVEELIGAA
ncbi:deoxyribodipyrimidine photo-lyase [Truepera radiovictrix]|nr:deoxyribodipyrimidine photo-lyase [Truepera radiovictrix]WMT57020.1 deoxyribodipyrimidine photo-lyase [Truepera radiovictrix]